MWFSQLFQISLWILRRISTHLRHLLVWMLIFAHSCVLDEVLYIWRTRRVWGQLAMASMLASIYGGDTNILGGLAVHKIANSHTMRAWVQSYGLLRLATSSAYCRKSCWANQNAPAIPIEWLRKTTHALSGLQLGRGGDLKLLLLWRHLGLVHSTTPIVMLLFAARTYWLRLVRLSGRSLLVLLLVTGRRLLLVRPCVILGWDQSLSACLLL